MKNINWKKVEKMKPGDSHIHEEEFDANAYRYEKLHYVNRPYLKYASSKWEMHYIDLYDILLNPWKHKPDAKILEFGVFTGESIRYFRDYFTNPGAQIIGFDHQTCEFYGHDWYAKKKGIPNTDDAGEPYSGNTHNVTLFKGEQNNPQDVYTVCEGYGPFDIIIDDASHHPRTTEDVWRTAWKYVKEDGLYIIEDIGEQEISHLMDEVTVTRQGRGVICKPAGFGPGGGGASAVALVLLKSKYSITGIDEVLTE
jgi:cephalosporin hydroxylase